MPTFADIKKLAQQFDKTVADAKKNPKVAKLLEYTTEYSKHYNFHAAYETEEASYWKNLSEQHKQEFLKKDHLEITQHIEFVKSVVALKEAIDNPVNNPREFKTIRNSKDKHVKTNAVKIIPTLKEVLKHAIETMEYRSAYNRSESRGEILTYLSQSLKATADVVNSKFQDPGKLEVLLSYLNPASNKKERMHYDTRNFITRICSKNPNAAQFMGLLTASIGITMIIMASAMSAVPGALAVTLPLIAAGLVLTASGASLAKLCERYVYNSQSKMHQEQVTTGIEKFSARYTAMMTSKEVKDAYKNADHLVRKAEGIEMQPVAPSPRMAMRRAQ